IHSELDVEDRKSEIRYNYVSGYSHLEIVKVLNSVYYNPVIKKDDYGYEDICKEYLKYNTNNRFAQDEAIRFLHESNITQKQISTYFNLSIRPVRNALNLE